MSRSWLLLSPFLVALVLPPSRPDPQPARCIVVRDATSGRALAGARVRAVGAQTTAWSDGTGRACLGDAALPTDARLLVDAIGYRSVMPLDAPGSAPIVALRRVSVTELQADSGLRRDQLELALSQLDERLVGCESLVVPSCAQAMLADTARKTVVVGDVTATRLAREGLSRRVLPLLSELRALYDSSESVPQLSTDADGAVLSAYVDSPDTATRFAEVRLALRAGGRTSIGVTETRCPPTGCEKSRQMAMLWGVDGDSVVAPELALIDDGASRGATIFDVSTMIRPRMVARRDEEPARLVRVSGVVQDERGRPLRDVEIVSTSDVEPVRTDSLGRYALRLPSDRATVLTARLIGFAPAYRTIAAGADEHARWMPRLRSVQQLAARTVRESGLPFGMGAWRFDDVLARRARGIGKFLVGEEIWSATLMGDVLQRVPGVHVYMGANNNIAKIRMLRCNRQSFQVADGEIGVYVNGFERTSMSGIASTGGAAFRPATLTAEELLSDFQPGELMAVEVYRGRGEIPGEFANPRYCAVISVWTR
jgi:hypothetical protein